MRKRTKAGDLNEKNGFFALKNRSLFLSKLKQTLINVSFSSFKTKRVIDRKGSESFFEAPTIKLMKELFIFHK